MNILLLTQWFEPEPTFKGLVFAKALVSRGHHVEVLTGFPNYPGGNIYLGYRRRLVFREVMDGIPVTRVWLHPDHSTSIFGRIANYLSFAAMATAGLGLVRRPDVAYVYHPPGTIGIPAAALRLLLNVPYVLDVQDLWPDTVAATGMLRQPLILSALTHLCAFVYRHASHIVVQSHGFQRVLSERGVPLEKLSVIYNWSDEVSMRRGSDSVAAHSQDARPPGEFTVMFAGTMGKGQGLDAVLDAARICQDRMPAVRFVFVGGGIERDRLADRARTLALTNTEFLERQPMHRMGGILASADALLIHLKDDPLFRITIPSKTQAYMAAGRPIIMAVRGDAAQMVADARAGILCEPENPESLVAAIAEMVALPADARRAMGEAGAAYYESHLSVREGVLHFERIFQAVSGATR